MFMSSLVRSLDDISRALGNSDDMHHRVSSRNLGLSDPQ